jgi:hypothetical protein
MTSGGAAGTPPAPLWRGGVQVLPTGVPIPRPPGLIRGSSRGDVGNNTTPDRPPRLLGSSSTDLAVGSPGQPKMFTSPVPKSLGGSEIQHAVPKARPVSPRPSLPGAERSAVRVWMRVRGSGLMLFVCVAACCRPESLAEHLSSSGKRACASPCKHCSTTQTDKPRVISKRTHCALLSSSCFSFSDLSSFFSPLLWPLLQLLQPLRLLLARRQLCTVSCNRRRQISLVLPKLSLN